MKFKVGALVQLLDEAYGGIVIAYIPPNSYEIRTPDGFSETHGEKNLVIASEPGHYKNTDKACDKEYVDITSKNKPSANIRCKIVDLHCYDPPSSSSLNNPAIRRQLDKVTLEMERALAKNTKEIIFIHGKGEGVLRLEIRKLLDKHYPDASYMDASFRDFGMKGATKVICF